MNLVQLTTIQKIHNKVTTESKVIQNFKQLFGVSSKND